MKSRDLQKYEWTSMLAREHAVCMRSATRGIGSSKQCKEIEMEVFVKAATKLAEGYHIPVGLQRTAVICYFFVIREIGRAR